MLQPCRANINCERTVDPPWGVQGGHSAATNSAIVHRAADGTDSVVLKATELPLATGDVVTFLTAGGGGYGSPAERAPAALARDVAEGFVSQAAAKREYGTH
jgi:N-methylhydantoinase B